jgi:hypothetical protein
MTIVRVAGAGSVGVNKDLSQHELPIQAWTDARNIRFVAGSAAQATGYRELYPGAPAVPFHVMPLDVLGVRTWLYAGAGKLYTVGDGAVHSNITRQTSGADVDYNAQRNSWSSCLLGGIPVLNNGVDVPQQWLLTGRATALSAWPADHTAGVIRTYKNSLIALNITKNGVNRPFLVKWSHPADPGSVPVTWDIADATKDAGENDLSEGYDPIVDGLTLRDSFLIYKESSVWRMDYTGGPFVYRFAKVLGTSGALARNCIAEIDGLHFVLSSSDCIVHDGQQARSVLDKQSRRELFQRIDPAHADQCFVFINRLYNEVWACYPTQGNVVCNEALVWNYVDKTVAFRDLPGINHGACGAVEDTTGSTWSSDAGSWDNDTTRWDASGSSLNRALCVLAGDTPKLYLLDSGATFDGAPASALLERVGLSLGAPEKIKLLSRLRPRISGTAGKTVLVSLGSADDAFGAVTWQAAVPFVIGQTVSVDALVAGRYLAVRFATGSAPAWRLDSYDLDVIEAGAF